MFASQLLRILQTLPADAKYEPRFLDSAELKVRVTKKYYKEADSLSFNTKELLHSKDSGKVDDFLNAPELEHSKVEEDLIIDQNSEIRVTPELECSLIMDECTNHNEHESQVSGAPFISFYTDKTVLEYELPELIVCYKEINYHVVKDLGVDDGIPVEDTIKCQRLASNVSLGR